MPYHLVYVFIGEHIAMVDFVRCLQNRGLLESGDYIVVSVDDEIYNANRRVNIMERSKLNSFGQSQLISLSGS